MPSVWKEPPCKTMAYNRHSFFILNIIPQRLLSEPTYFRHRQIDLNLPNDESALQHELVREIVATSSNTERAAIVIKEGEHLGHL